MNASAHKSEIKNIYRTVTPIEDRVLDSNKTNLAASIHISNKDLILTKLKQRELE